MYYLAEKPSQPEKARPWSKHVDKWKRIIIAIRRRIGNLKNIHVGTHHWYLGNHTAALRCMDCYPYVGKLAICVGTLMYG